MLSPTRTVGTLSKQLKNLARPVEDATDLADQLVEIAKDKRCVLLGEASHGTHDFYKWRAVLSRRLIEDHGFNFVAVEGDWPAIERLNLYGLGRDDVGTGAVDVLRHNRRWPTWMWANWEVVAFGEWLREHNAGHPKASIYGLDVYSLWESLNAIITYLKEHDPSALPVAEQAFRCFEPYRLEAGDYARATALVPASCEDEVVALLTELRGANHKDPAATHTQAERFSAQQNALVAVNAERYYRTMMKGGNDSWNVRDHHMMGTLERLFGLHGPDSKGIVWAHNTHVGDARFTDMAAAGMVNVGQLSRQRFGDDALLVGFSTYQGKVIAARDWNGTMETMTVPEAEEGSWEAEFHGAGAENRLLLSRDVRDIPEFNEWRGHRAIGVVYQPEVERFGNYVPSVIPQRYDALVHIDKIKALRALDLNPDTSEPPDTYPWGF